MDIKQEEERLKKQFKKNRSSVKSRRASTPSTPPCYDIGDIGPGGGIVFALPNTGINNSNFVYEINTDPIQLATTPLALLPNECRNQKLLTIKTRDVGQTVPNNAIVVDYGPGSNNPSFFPSDVNVGDILNAFDINGNVLFSPGVVPTVTLKTLLPNNFVFIAFSAFMNGPANSQPSETVTFYTTPGFVPVNGAEWGGYDKPIITSELFGEGKKNTDIIAAVTQTNNPPSHPTVPSHDIAADLTLAFSQNNLDDWFLPSYEELEEAFNVLGSNGLDVLPNPPGINDEKTVYWTSTGLNPVNNQLAGNVNSNELAWAYITPFNTHILYRKCKTLSVLPVRRFECEVIDKGIQYDYRLARSCFQYGNSTGGTTSFPVQEAYTPGVMGFLGDTTSTTIDIGDEFDVDVEIIANGTDPSGFSPPSTQYPNGISAGDVVVKPLPGTGGVAGPAMIGFTWDSGNIQFDPSSWGPMQYITSNGRWVFDDSGFFAQTSLPIGTVKNMTGNNFQTVPNPNYTPSVFGNSMKEIGKPRLNIRCASHDVRLNSLARFWKEGGMGPTGGICGTYTLFNIKVYSQFEELLGDWDYKLCAPGEQYNCALDRCEWELKGLLVNTNYVNPNYAHPIQTSVIDLTYLFNRPNGGPYQNPGSGPSTFGPYQDEGSAYVSLELKQTEYVTPGGQVWPLSWTNYNPPSWSNGRGNTLNLENWMGTGLNRRAKDPNNLPPEWSTIYNRFPWGVVCYPCGISNYTNECNNIWKREWMAELPYSDFVYVYQNLPNTLPFDCTGNLITTPNYVSTLNSWGSFILGDTPALSYPNIPINQIVNGWYDLQIGHTCQQGGLSNEFTNDNNAKLIELNSYNNENYNKEIKACFENDSFGNRFMFENPNGQIIYDESNSRQSFAINNKKIEETGPFAIAGYYPLYDTIKGARFASPIPLEARESEDTHGYHIHEFNGIEYYMPNGLKLGVTQFHGNYDGQIIEESKTEITQEVVEQEEEITYIQPQQEVQEQETPIVLPEEDEELPPPPPTYTPPPSSSSSSGSGGY